MVQVGDGRSGSSDHRPFFLLPQLQTDSQNRIGSGAEYGHAAREAIGTRQSLQVRRLDIRRPASVDGLILAHSLDADAVAPLPRLIAV
jgi:hypothetical protein